MASKKNPDAAATAKGLSEFVQAALLNTSEDKPIPENFQRLDTVTGLDPARWPILARHWPVDNPRSAA